MKKGTKVAGKRRGPPPYKQWHEEQKARADKLAKQVADLLNEQTRREAEGSTAVYDGGVFWKLIQRLKDDIGLLESFIAQGAALSAPREK